MVIRRGNRSYRWAALLVPLWASGCAALLGIEDAVCDPKFDSQCAPSAVADAAADAGALAQREHVQLCAEYCNLVTPACQDAEEQYLDLLSCNEVCSELMDSAFTLQVDDPNTLQTGNTVECRLQAAQLAAEQEDVPNSCATAGMYGNEQCGSSCEVYCSLLEAACKSEFDVFDDCERECEQLDKGEGLFSSNVQMGNNLMCRVYHIRLATSERRPEIHCPHAAGQGPCE